MSSPKAPGCVVTSEDSSRVLTSVAIFFCFLSFGACLAALGAAIPQLSDASGSSETELGYFFVARGCGYLVGTLASAGITELRFLKDKKMLIVSLGILFSGLALSLVDSSISKTWMCVLLILQGNGFGFVDTLCNIVLPELWGNRVQPWMQAAHANFGVGGIVGPALVGSLGYKKAFFLLALSSFLPLIIIMQQIIWRVVNPPENRNRFILYKKVNSFATDETLAIDDDDDIEMTDKDLSDNIDNVESAHGNLLPLPMNLKLLLTFFYFVYVGIEMGFGGWISSFSSLTHLASNHAQAAYCTSSFFTAMACGRLLAIPSAVYLSNTFMLKMQLFLFLIVAIVTCFTAELSYTAVVVNSALVGFACSSLFPLVMTIVGDYGFLMDSYTTTMFVVGSTCGEAVIPIFLGFLMHVFGPMALLYATLVSALIISFICGLAHIMMQKISVDIKNETMKGKKLDEIELTESEIE